MSTLRPDADKAALSVSAVSSMHAASVPYQAVCCCTCATAAVHSFTSVYPMSGLTFSTSLVALQPHLPV